jgi:hypothetical protein
MSKLAHMRCRHLLHAVQPLVGRFRDVGVPISCGVWRYAKVADCCWLLGTLAEAGA